MAADAQSLGYSVQLVAQGWLPWWAGVVVFAGVGWFVWHQLRCEFPRRDAGVLPRWVLPAIRLLLVGTFAWLLCRPALVVTRRWRIEPELLVSESVANSMNAIEEFGSLSEKIDALEAAGGKMLPKRNRAGSQLARVLDSLLAACSLAEKSLRDEAARAESGLPLGQSFADALKKLRVDLAAGLDGMAAVKAGLRVAVEDKELQKSLADVLSRFELAFSGAQSLDREAEMVAREAPARPQMVAGFADKLVAAASQLRDLRAAARSSQLLLDRVLLGEQVLEGFRVRSYTRRNLAELCRSRIRDQVSGNFRVVVPAQGRDNLVEQAFERSLGGNLSGVVFVGDGATPIAPAERQALDRLRLAGVPVHTVLVGTDGVEPRDIGLISVDLRGTALVGCPITARVLVKSNLPAEQRPRIEVRSGGELLAAADIPAGGGSIRVLELPLVFRRPGRHSLVFAVGAAARDAYPGNERFVTIVDVLDREIRALIVSDRLRNDIPAYVGVLQGIPGVRPEVMIGEPGLSSIEVGSEPGDFPATVQDWQGVGVAILLGDVPDGLPESAIQALLQAVEGGLHVLIHASPPNEGARRAVERHGKAERSDRGWASVFGWRVEHATAPQKLRPSSALWFEPCALATGGEGCRRRWDALPSVSVSTFSANGASVMVETAAGPAVSTFLRGRGMIVFCGVRNLAELRSGGNEADANRILYGLATHALRPAAEMVGGAEVVLIPPQPRFREHFDMYSKAGPPQELEGLEPASAWQDAHGVYVVTDRNRIAFTLDGHRFERAVQVDSGPEDFELTPHAKNLIEISEATGGRYTDLVGLTDMISGLKGIAAVRSSVAIYRLWVGWAPLVLILTLVCAEYLLRRKAGRVM